MSTEQITPQLSAEKVVEKGGVFQNYSDFYKAYCGVSDGPAKGPKIVRIFGKKIENREMVDDPDSFVDSIAHKIGSSYANMNVFSGRELIYWFQLDQKNINQFRIEVFEKEY